MYLLQLPEFKLEQAGTKDHGKMMKRIQVLHTGRIPDNYKKISGDFGTSSKREDSRRRRVYGNSPERNIAG